MSAVLPKATLEVLTRQGGVVTPTQSGDEQLAVCVFATGAPVERYDWLSGSNYTERLSMESGAVRLERMNKGQSVLDTHHSYSLEDVLGHVVEGSVQLTGGELRGTIMVTSESAWAKVKIGSVRSLSIGYKVHRWEITEATATEKQIRLAVEWTPYEVSLVPLGADENARIESTRSLDTGGNRIMDQSLLNLPVTAERAATLTQNMPKGTAQAWIEAGITEQQGRGLALAEIRNRTEPDGPGGPNVISMGEDLETRGRHDAMIDGILHRADPKKWPLENEQARQYAGLTLFELARICLGRAGNGLTDRNRIVSAALSGRSGGMLTTSDFPSLLGDSFNKSLRREYADMMPTFERIVTRSSAVDFKNINRLQVGDAPDLKEVAEHGEVTVGALGEGKEVFKIAEFARIVAITRQALVNDDLDAFQRLPRLLAIAARHLESDLVWKQLTDNGDMGDGTALFHATHNNLASSAGAISTTTLGAGHAAMRKQKGIDGRLIDLRPATLIVPVAKEILALKQIADITADSADNANPFSAMLEVVAEPRLDEASATQWYLAADIAQTDVIELATLNGVGPQVETKIGFEVSGIQFKVSHDVGAKILDWRGLYRNNGA